MFCMLPYHPDRNHQATPNSHTVHGLLEFLMSPIGKRQQTVLAGNLR